MTKSGKRLREVREGIDRERQYPAQEAVKLVKNGAKTKLDETVEIAINLGVDPRHADQMVRGVVALPNGTGKAVRVAVFAKDDKAEEAKAKRHEREHARAELIIAMQRAGLITVNQFAIDVDEKISVSSRLAPPAWIVFFVFSSSVFASSKQPPA